MRAPTTPLADGELVRASWWANYSQHAQRAVGGRLHLTDRRLIFEPHAVDRALSGRTVVVPLALVAVAGRTAIDLRHFFGGGLRRRLAVRLTDGAELLFVVNKADAKAATIREAAGLI